MFIIHTKYTSLRSSWVWRLGHCWALRSPTQLAAPMATERGPQPSVSQFRERHNLRVSQSGEMWWDVINILAYITHTHTYIYIYIYWPVWKTGPAADGPKLAFAVSLGWWQSDKQQANANDAKGCKRMQKDAKGMTWRKQHETTHININTSSASSFYSL